MTLEDQIRDEELQYEYLTGEDILPSNQQQIIEQALADLKPKE